MKRLGIVILGMLAGCASHRPMVPRQVVVPAQYYLSMGLTQPQANVEVQAQCDPPTGWTAQPLRKSDHHSHQIWESPSKKTAYGVMHFKMPVPVGVGLAHWGFLREMKKKEGEAIELSEREDPSLPGLRFVCEGGRYKMRVNMTVNGFEGWAAYAGTLRAEPEAPEELQLAEQARENTIFGLPDQTVSVPQKTAPVSAIEE